MRKRKTSRFETTIHGVMADVLRHRKAWALEHPCDLLDAFMAMQTPEDAARGLSDAATWLQSAFPAHASALRARLALLEQQRKETLAGARTAIETYMALWTLRGEDAARFLRIYPDSGYDIPLRAAIEALSFEDDPPAELVEALGCFAYEEHESLLRRPDLRGWRALLPADG